METSIIEYKAVKLTPRNAEHWSLWPEYERRLHQLSPSLAPETPIEPLLVSLRKAFTEDSPIHCLIAVSNGTSIIAHLVAWIESAWGNNWVWIHQCQSDCNVERFYKESGGVLMDWIDGINSQIQVPITKIRWASERGSAWHRHFKGFAKFDRSVLSLELGNLRQAFNEVSEHGRK